jgi:hypothetical protein
MTNPVSHNNKHNTASTEPHRRTRETIYSWLTFTATAEVTA